MGESIVHWFCIKYSSEALIHVQMMKTLAISDGSPVRITSTELDPGAILRLRPQEDYGIDRVRLENALKKVCTTHTP